MFDTFATLCCPFISVALLSLVFSCSPFQYTSLFLSVSRECGVSKNHCIFVISLQVTTTQSRQPALRSTQNTGYSLKNSSGVSLLWIARQLVGCPSAPGLPSSVQIEWNLTSASPWRRTLDPQGLSTNGWDNSPCLEGHGSCAGVSRQPLLERDGGDSPYVDKALALLVLDSWNADLAQDDDPVAHGATAHENKVLVQIEMNQLFVGNVSRSGPHPRLVLVPVVARFHDRRLDVVQDDVESLNRIVMRRVRGIERDSFSSRCETRSQGKSIMQGHQIWSQCDLTHVALIVAEGRGSP